jgi:hypothetical protein
MKVKFELCSISTSSESSVDMNVLEKTNTHISTDMLYDINVKFDVSFSTRTGGESSDST